MTKPIPAIIERDIDGDIAKHAAAVDSALRNYREAIQHAEDAERRAEIARNVVARMRLDLGKALAAARKCWPASGPRAKGWGDFLKVRAIDEDVALDAMKYAGFVEERFPDTLPDNLPTRREAGIESKPLAAERDPKPESEPPTLTEEQLLEQLARLAPEARKRIQRALKPANVNGGSGEVERGTYCTPQPWALAAGPWDLDPFSNPRSHIEATVSCQLERGDDGLLDLSHPGSYYIAPRTDDERQLARYNREPFQHVAGPEARVWIQPPYEIAEEAIAHYGHTRFCALLRLDSSTAWFDTLIRLTAVIALPLERLEFEAPPGLETSANPYPHAFYFANEHDVTDEIRRLCIVLRIEHNT